ncbi:hypothetical protein [Lysobacter silvisoli]|uniref:Uncharacterized protein n=1 Tax=Lysobacter silvisoli TaxID=2293254 RepID=A0A371JZ52_9GAMM|nr:hypothetical protein [Lysobacter silvisoli]RDZ26955.1 hypothetical protein DX914_11820 [Lysobacter silvisoli]
MTRTNAFSLLSVAIRAVALWSLISLLVVGVSRIFGLRQMVDDGGWLLMAGAAFMLALGAVALLWLFADKIARLTLARPQDQSFDSDLEPAVWLGLAISIIGAFGTCSTPWSTASTGRCAGWRCGSSPAIIPVWTRRCSPS